MAREPAWDDDQLRALPDLIRAIQDLRLAAALLVTTPAHPRIVEAVNRLVGEVYRLRMGPWLDEAAQEIASDPRCGDPKSAHPRFIAETLRRFAARPAPQR